MKKVSLFFLRISKKTNFHKVAANRHEFVMSSFQDAPFFPASGFAACSKPACD